MPDEDTDLCGLSCQTKQILNSGNIAGITQTTYQALTLFYTGKGSMPKGGKKLIAMMNELEDLAVAVQKHAMKCMGYDGPTGKMLE